LADSPDDIIERAKRYPYEIPERSFILFGDRTLTLEDLELDNLLESRVRVDGTTITLFDIAVGSDAIAGSDRRIPVLGYGSNAAPAQLRRKMEGVGHAVAIPVVRATIKDFDVVYSAHIGRYGPIPATIHPSPGTHLSVFLTYLTPPELKRMFVTEHGNYDYVELNDVTVEGDSGERLSKVHAYLSKYGALGLVNTPLALEAVRAERRRYRSITEPEALDLVAAAVAPGVPVDKFIVRAATERETRREWIRALESTSIAFDWPSYRVVSR
jgi:hypothetical protein